MKDKMAKISLLYKLLIVIVTGIGLYLNFKFITFQNGIVYFTIQSNLLCLLFYVIYLMLDPKGKKEKKDKYYLFKGMITSCITLTMIVYTILVLMGDMHAYDSHFIECIFVHYITPLLVIFDYILFDEKGKMKGSYPFIWGSILILYGLFYVTYVRLGGTFFESSYAYSFLNIEKYGKLGALANCIIIYICFILNGFIMIHFDDKKGGRQV